MTMTEELIQKNLNRLPSDQQEEVLDFINYLLWRQRETVAPQQYDFSDIAGKLSWQGDAVAVQRELRDAWRC